jgi:hypothetical protein
LRVTDPIARGRIVKQAIADEWSMRRIRQEVDRWNASIPFSAVRAPIDKYLEATLRELDALTLEVLTAEERRSATRLMQRLTSMLGSERRAGWGLGRARSQLGDI